MKPHEEKALRLIKEGRVHVTWTNGDAGQGIVDGDNDTYVCSFSPAGRVCSCPAYRHCSHALALELKVMAWEPIQLELV